MPFLLGATAMHAATEFGTVVVEQLAAGNETSALTLSLGPGSSSGASVTGGNRGDYNVSFGNTSDPATGVLISCAAQNTRDDSAVGGPALTPHHATTAVQVSGSRYYIPTFRSPEGDEANINASFVFLPYNTWLAGLASNADNGADLTSFTGSSGLALGTQFVDSTATEGEYALNLSPLVTNASQKGILLVAGAKNEDNYALSKANSDGTFTIYDHDNGANGASYENDPVAFAYLPVSAVGTNRLVALGRVNGDASTDVAGGSFTVTKGGTGVCIMIAGHTRVTGTLIVSAEGGTANNADNIVTSEWDEANGRWVIESRDLPGADLQNMAAAGDDAFSFAFFSASTGNGTPPAVSLSSPASGASFTTATPVVVNATASDDGAVSTVRFYDGETLIGEDRTAPYQFVWSQPPLGTHVLNARATDNFGFVTRSASSTITVTPPAGSGGLFFDGTDDRVTFGKNTNLQLTTFTVECWFRSEGGGIATNSGGLNAIPLVAKGRGDSLGANFFLGIDADSGKLAADFKSATETLNHSLIGSTVISTGVWHHATVTYDGTQLALYLDANLEGTIGTDGDAPAASANQYLTLGAAQDSTGAAAGAFFGQLDELRIWNRARTPEEIRASLNLAIPADVNLVCRHAMNEASGTTLTASPPSSLTGTLVNGVFHTAGAPFNLNTPPGIVPTAPAHGQTGVERNAVLSTTTDDPEDASLTVRYFGRSTVTAPLEDFSIVALPDTQFYSENVGGNLAEIFSAQTDWVVANRNSLKIAAVLHLGDISQHGDNPSTYATEWSNASSAMYRLENPLTTMLPQGIPYSMAVGNHDQTPIGNADGTTTGFNTYFGVHPVNGHQPLRWQDLLRWHLRAGQRGQQLHPLQRRRARLHRHHASSTTIPRMTRTSRGRTVSLKAHPTRCGIITTHWTVEYRESCLLQRAGVRNLRGAQEQPEPHPHARRSHRRGRPPLGYLSGAHGPLAARRLSEPHQRRRWLAAHPHLPALAQPHRSPDLLAHAEPLRDGQRQQVQHRCRPLRPRQALRRDRVEVRCSRRELRHLERAGPLHPLRVVRGSRGWHQRHPHARPQLHHRGHHLSAHLVDHVPREWRVLQPAMFPSASRFPHRTRMGRWPPYVTTPAPRFSGRAPRPRTASPGMTRPSAPAR
ncbi:MAG: Ig-like domain-containing protein [Luteolibacter sp.]